MDNIISSLLQNKIRIIEALINKIESEYKNVDTFIGSIYVSKKMIIETN